MKAQKRIPAYKPPKRFIVGAHVRIKNPGIHGFVTHVADERTALSEYWHKVNMKCGERDEPGCNLELIPPPIGLPASPKSVRLADNIHFHGPNARINVDSKDHSTNTVLTSKDRVFVQLRERATSIDDAQERAEVLTRIETLENTHGTDNFLAAYQAFIASASNHISVFGMLLPALAQMLSGGS